jgi:hypothetical protein
MADFQDKQTNAGSGGAYLPTIDVANATTGHTDSFPVGTIAFASGIADVTGALQGVDSTHGLPVNVVAGSVTLGASSAAIGSVTVSNTVAVSGTFWQATQGVSIADAAFVTFGAQADSAASSDTATATYMGLFKRLLQRITTLLGQLPIALTGNGNLKAAIVESTATVTVAGTVTANIGTTNGLALDATLTGGTLKAQVYDGTNVIGTSSHPVRVDPVGATAQPISGTVTANAGSGTFAISGAVTANAGTNLNTSALALDTSVNGLLVTQGSTTSGEKGPLIQAAVTTSAPSYATAQTSPLSLTTAGALRVDGSAVTQPVSVSGTATVAGSGTFSTQDAADGSTGAAVPAKAIYIGATSGGNLTGLVTDASGFLKVNVAAGSIVVTGSGTFSVTQSGTWNVGLNSGSNNVGYFTPAPASATTGATPFKLSGSANSTNATSVNGSACTLWDLVAVNVSSSAMAYLKIYDKASAPTVGSDTPVYILPLPYATSGNGGGASKQFPVGLKLVNGLSFAITGGMADSDTTAVAANQVLLSGTYK